MSLNQIPDFMLSDETGSVKDKIAVLSGAGGVVEKTNKSEFAAQQAETAKHIDNYKTSSNTWDEALNLAITAAIADKSLAVKVKGSYIFYDTCILPDNLTIYAETPNGAEFVYNGTGVLFQSNSLYTNAPTLKNIRIRQGTGTKVGTAISTKYLTGTWGSCIKIKACSITNFEVGLSLCEAFNSDIDDLRITSCKFAIRHPNNPIVGSATFSNVNIFERVTILGCDVGIDLGNSKNNLYLGCTMEDVTIGIMTYYTNVSWPTHNKFVTCWFERIATMIVNSKIDEETLVQNGQNKVSLVVDELPNKYNSSNPLKFIDCNIDPVTVVNILDVTLEPNLSKKYYPNPKEFSFDEFATYMQGNVLAKNLLKNGGYESSGTFWNPQNANTTLSKQTDSPYRGVGYLRVACNESATGGFAFQSIGAVAVGEMHVIYLATKADNANPFTVSILEIGTGIGLGSCVMTPLKGDGNWEILVGSIKVATPSASPYVALYPDIAGNTANKTRDFDAIALYKADETQMLNSKFYAQYIGYTDWQVRSGFYRCDANGDGVADVPYGVTVFRPKTDVIGYMYYDTDLSKPIWFNGSVWKDAAGTTV